MRKRTCVVCGAELNGRQQKYCGRACAIKGNTIARANNPDRLARHKENKLRWQRDNPDRVKSYQRWEIRGCAWCGRDYRVRVCNPSRCCSKRCGSAHEGAATSWRPPKPEKFPASRIPWATCRDCGKPFVYRRGGYPRCGECNGKAIFSKHWKLSPKRRLAIYERDGWTCQLCGEPVERDAHPLSDWAPSIDHIIPRILGGRHTDDNMQLAHRWCNSVKGYGAYWTADDLKMPA